jgi:predicted nucleic acid-binding protein
MSSSSFPSNPRASLVADASVVINLNATACAADIIKALPNPFVVTENACAELEAGIRNGHRDYGHLLELIDGGHVRRARLGAAAMPVYEALIDGSTLRTLDDGEAATIAYAHEIGAAVVIDERKARKLCLTSFPGLLLVSTAELLMHSSVTAALGPLGQSEALSFALRHGRMRVPPEHVARVTTMLGPERSAQCASLPRIARKASA